MKLAISPKKVTAVLLGVTLLLAFAGASLQLSRFLLGQALIPGLAAPLNLGREANIPTFYSALMLVFCSALLAAIAFYKRGEGGRYVRHWGVLAGIFLCLGFDEASKLHEMMSRPTRSLLNLEGGLLHYSWVVPGLVFVLVVFLSYLRFLRDLPRTTAILFLLAGALFVGGAVGVEILGSRHAGVHGNANLTAQMLAWLEETLEMLGVVVFAHALMTYMSANLGELRLSFRR